MDEVIDIVPQLLEAIQESYEDNVNKNILLQKIIRIIEDDKGDGETLLKASKEYGAALGKAFKEHISEDILPDGKMYYNIAQRLLEPLMKVNYDNVAPLCVKVQTKLNKQNKMNLKAVKPSYKKEKTDGLIDYISSCEHYSDREESLIDAVETNSKSIVDDSVRENAEFQASCGMSPVIERYAVGKTCKWCASLAGTYQYPDQVPREVYKRHANCDCVVMYKPDKRAKDFQDVWSKQWNNRETLKRKESSESKKTANSFKAIKELSNENVWAINSYISSDSYKINECLRNGTELPSNLKNIAENLDDALNKLPVYKGNLTRSLYFYDKESLVKYLQKIVIGEPITFPEYLSTTKRGLYNPSAQVQILIYNSKKGTDISYFNPEEKEVLYKRNSTFMVNDIQEKNRKYYIWLEEL